MRIALPLALVLYLAVAWAARPGARAKLPPELACPERGRVHVILDSDENVSRKEVDTNGDGRADELFFLDGDRVDRAELDLDYDGATDVWLRYDGYGRPLEWEALPPASRDRRAGRP